MKWLVEHYFSSISLVSHSQMTAKSYESPVNLPTTSDQHMVNARGGVEPLRGVLAARAA